jgi:hypothetical protein
MSFTSNIEFLEAVEDLVEMMEEDKLYYSATLSIDSKSKNPTACIENGKLTILIGCKGKGKISYMMRDDGEVRHARVEGFTENDIEENIKCFHEINQQLAEVLLTVPEFWGKMKREVIDEKVAKLNKQAKKD